MDPILTILEIALLSWLVLGGVFLSYPTVVRLKEYKDELGWISLVPIYLWLVLGAIADICFNVTWGTWIFKELPREFMFTHRLRRHWYGNSESMKRKAEPWVKRVNLVDPGHV